MNHNQKRFSFGQNWLSFLRYVDEERIQAAIESLQDYLGFCDFKGKTFLDIGCGSGLFSLAARRLGAKVYSFDYDLEAVKCTEILKSRFYPGDENWVVTKGSVLDKEFLEKLGKFDIVYAWGVLHHTGNLTRAMALTAELVKPEGVIYLAIYNYQPYWSSFHRQLKRLYVHSPGVGRFFLLSGYIFFQVTKGLVKDLLLFRNPFDRYKTKKRIRGMSVWHDWVDWVGGYPFETAKPEDVFDFFSQRRFILKKLKTCGGGHGCNEFVFQLIKEESGKGRED